MYDFGVIGIQTIIAFGTASQSLSKIENRGCYLIILHLILNLCNKNTLFEWPHTYAYMTCTYNIVLGCND